MITRRFEADAHQGLRSSEVNYIFPVSRRLSRLSRATRFHAFRLCTAGKAKINSLERSVSERGNSDALEAATYELDKEQIRKFYDVVSSHFHDLWGDHLHHGYWVHGDETKETAQLQLIDRLARQPTSSPDRSFWTSGAERAPAASIWQSNIMWKRRVLRFLPCKWNWRTRLLPARV